MNTRDLANGIVSTAISPTNTTIMLRTGDGSGMPEAPFKATICPYGELATRGNSEIVTVTSVSGDALIVQRAQSLTTAKSFSPGAIVSAGVYTDALINDSNISLGEEVTNTGTAGGAYRLFNLGSIKIAFGNTAPKTGATASYFVKFPSGTFSATPAFICNIQTAYGSVGGNNVLGNVWDSANQTMNIYWNNATGNTSVGGVVSFICIGV